MNPQEKFWKEEYADRYLAANQDFDEKLGIEGWSKMLAKAEAVNSYLECGCNLGRNLGFLQNVLPKAKPSLVEISDQAFAIASERYAPERSFHGPILDSNFAEKSFDLVFTCGVLIHVHPDQLLDTMKKMVGYSRKYVLIAEYFNRTPVSIEYQGRRDTLFKRDFGKFFLEHFQAPVLDYGFLWGHYYDSAGFDDITYWLFDVGKC